MSSAAQPTHWPAYLALGPEVLAAQAAELRRLGTPCRWCPRRCGADRLGGAEGACGAAAGIVLASFGRHRGEERHVSGVRGSGTVFFGCCNLGCIFCQNADISHGRAGTVITVEDLAGVFLALQAQGVENLNLVTPSHYPADILQALALAARRGFRLPLLWNSSGYDAVEVLRFFDGVVDIYMPDLKFSTDELGERLTQVSDYATVARAALAEMVRQVGPALALDLRRVARRGMTIRHLVLPGHYADSRACLDLLAAISPDLTVNLMSQYHPSYRAGTVPELTQELDWREYRALVDYARGLGLTHLLAQG